VTQSSYSGWGGGPVPPNRPERDAAGEERAVAAVAYLFWPLAIPTIIDSGDPPRSAWLKRHARQSIVVGLCSWAIIFVVFSLPFFLILSGTIAFEHTIALYEGAFLVDTAIVGLSMVVAVRCARKASRGEQFDLRQILPIAKKDPS
jgi:uncharacterized membrane protein